MYEAALMQGKQSLGGNGAFSLLRTQTDIANFAPPSEGVAKFRLANASAGVIGLDSKLIEAVKVNQASLDVNFANALNAMIANRSNQNDMQMRELNRGLFG
jgi:hypothetical protein